MPVEASAGRDTGGEHALIQLSEDTGGKYYYASSLPQLDSAFRQISEELRTQYLLAYYPSQRLSDSEFRRIQVCIHGVDGLADFHVRHRMDITRQDLTSNHWNGAGSCNKTHQTFCFV